MVSDPSLAEEGVDFLKYITPDILYFGRYITTENDSEIYDVQSESVVPKKKRRSRKSGSGSGTGI